MPQNLMLFDYTFVDNKADRTCFLLHGTGGNKDELLFLNNALSQKYNLLGLQGNVDEEGYARFFRRIKMGVFDQENIKEETEKLRKFITAWMKEQKTSVDKLAFLGYSNGANMILATMFYYPDLIKRSVLLHAMLPFEVKPGSLNLAKHQVFVSIGKQDNMVSESDQAALLNTLRETGADLTVKEYATGHHVSPSEIKDAVGFLTRD